MTGLLGAARSLPFVTALLALACLWGFRFYTVAYFHSELGGSGVAVRLLLSGMLRDCAGAALCGIVTLPFSLMGRLERLARFVSAGLIVILAALHAADAIFLRYNLRRLGFELFTLDMPTVSAAAGTGPAEAHALLIVTLLVGVVGCVLVFVWRSRAPGPWPAQVVLLLLLGLPALPAHLFSFEERPEYFLAGELEQSLPVSLIVSRVMLSFLPRHMDPTEADARLRRLMSEPSSQQVAGGLFLRTRAQVRPLLPDVRNVVVILLEGVAAVDVRPETTPAIHAIRRRAVDFTHFFANGLRTRNGLVAVTTGWPDIVDYSAVKTYAAYHSYSSLPEVFARHGFESVFLYGGDTSFEGYDRFLRRRGFSTIIGRSELARRSRSPATAFGDSYHDDVVMAELERLLDQPGRRFVLMLGLSTHPPFYLPPGEVPAADSEPYSRFLATLRFVDRVLGDFFDRAARSERARDTLFVITSDHTHHIRLGPLDNFRVPLLWVGPAFPPQRSATVGSHVDLLPTFQALLGGQPPVASAGRDLFARGEQDGFAYLTTGRGLGWVLPCGALFTQARSEETRTLLLDGSPGWCSGLSAPEARRDLLAYFQTTRNAMLRNRILRARQ